MELIILSAVNIVNYLDRILVQAVKPVLMHEWNISESEAGYLISAFIIGYCLFSPIFGYFSGRINRPTLMSLGILLWSGATILTGLASSYTSFFLARVLVGVGEASFATIAPPYIKDKYADPVKINKALSIFSAAIPVGSALGFVLGGVISEHLSWQYVFFLGGIPGILLAYYIFRLPEISGYASQTETASVKPQKGTMLLNIQSVLRKKIITFSIIGYVFNTFALQGIASTVAKYGMQIGFTLSEIDQYFGGILVISGFAGSLGGGWLSSKLASKLPDEQKVYQLMLFVSITAFIATPLLTLAILVQNKYLFLLFCFLAELLIFAGIAPLNSVIVVAAPEKLVALTQGITITTINIFGSFLAPIVLGYIADFTYLQIAMLFCPISLGISAILWFVGYKKG
jgi:MFS transporter, Spinster family, sphingosine-1-phosphate transporter